MSTTVNIILYIVAVLVVLVSAIFGNILVIVCCVTFRKLKTITNILICNLAVSDILLAGVVLPQKLHDMLHEDHFFEGSFLCKIVNFGPVFVITSSIYTLVCVSFERKRAITASNERQMTMGQLKILIPLTWLFAFVVSFPTLMEYSVNAIRTTHGNDTHEQLSCGSQRVSRVFSILNAIFVTIVSYSIPVIFMFKNYLQVALFVLRQGRLIRDNSGSNGQKLKRFQNRIRLVKLLVLVAVVFAVSWLPFFIILLYAKVTGSDASENATGFINLLLVALAAFSTAYNIILYVVFNPGFKQAIKDILCCRRSALLQGRDGRQAVHTIAYTPSVGYPFDS